MLSLYYFIATWPDLKKRVEHSFCKEVRKSLETIVDVDVDVVFSVDVDVDVDVVVVFYVDVDEGKKAMTKTTMM